MKIVSIFANHLFSFVYQNEDGTYQENEYDRLMDLWTDTEYLWNYAKENKVKDIKRFVNRRLEDAELIQDLLEDLSESGKPLDHYFQALDDYETGFKILALKKGKTSKYDGLRLYAIKIDENLFVITGGAIKMSLKMDDHPDTKNEKVKIYSAQAFLNENDVIDSDSFFEFLTELE
ncbi:hypothetical protein J1N10_04535 [Carboxylicivirga sp. A043]|uniref:hypothetical protein n=1 Tax=Carboxylicivirga litoralis TaxID=2816963 RepID=UPI0021CB073D|nr:hypothetical protein [Carboxylicivirga sp. A043]MCU4155229.1 hypothetical protein [Carboxylicivirga sp. A043]